MKKLIITCALLTAASVVSFAQSAQPAAASAAKPAPQAHAAPAHSPAEQMATTRTKIFEKQLTLNADQYKSVYQVELDFAQQIEEMRKHGDKPGPGQSAQMQMARDQKFKAILTADQYNKYESMKPKQPATTPAPVAAPGR